MKIYETRTAPNPRRVRIFLAEKNIPMDYVQVDIKQGENLNPEFRAMNPLGKVPVLELDGGDYIAETMAICRYFEELQPEPRLMGCTAREKAHIEQWQRWVELYFLQPVGQCFQHTTGYFSDRMQPVEQWGEICGVQSQSFMKLLNRHLATSSFIAGERFSIADITALCAVDFNRVNHIRIPDECRHLARWHDSVSSRPSAKA